MNLVYDNQVALHIALNTVFHKRVKESKTSKWTIALGCITTSFFHSSDRLENNFTKSLCGPRMKFICNKLAAY